MRPKPKIIFSIYLGQTIKKMFQVKVKVKVKVKVNEIKIFRNKYN
jgi:hypothetical protein